MKNSYLVAILLFCGSAQAGVFDLPAFLEPGRVSLGLEADVALTEGAGAAANFKPRLGISDFLNLQAIVGTGTGDRRFRLGGTLDIEYFPDVSWQPGLATPITFLYTRFRNAGNAALFVTPLIYKTFHSRDGVGFTPFIGLPIGWNARQSTLRGFTQISVGTMFVPRNLASWRFSAEAGFNLHQSYTYISGGLTFFIGGYDWNRKAGAPTEDGASGGENLGNQPTVDDTASYRAIPRSIRPI
jgi:hypothetical protein